MSDVDAQRRTACEPGELPQWAQSLGAAPLNLRVRQHLFECTKHLTVRVGRHDGEVNEETSTKLGASGWTSDPFPAAVVGRARGTKERGERGYKRGYVVCDVGAVQVNLRYVLLVERLFPGCTWAAPPSANFAPVQALVDGVIVALIAGQEPGTVGGVIGAERVPS